MDNIKGNNHSYFAYIWNNFKKDKIALFGLLGIILLVLVATFAPLIANGRPLCIISGKSLEFPFFYYIFSPDSSEKFVAKAFNYFMLYIPVSAVLFFLFKRSKKLRLGLLIVVAILLAIPFVLTTRTLDQTDWNAKIKNIGNSKLIITTPIPYGPFDIVGKPYEKPSITHLLGTDHIGRDISSRIIYGTRISIAVGVLATLISLIIGTSIGLISGYYAGITDLLIMRIVEIIICFPAFLLLLILMAAMMDFKFEQSVLVIALIIGFLGWTGLSRIVRGEVLKQREMQYIQACECLGMPNWRIMFVHLLPNVSGPILISAVFMIAANVLAESGLSFLGFGVQPPTASWGELLKEAFADPLRYWNLTLYPGLLIFFTILSFNLIGEGLRKSINAKPK